MIIFFDYVSEFVRILQCWKSATRLLNKKYRKLKIYNCLLKLSP